MSKRRTISQRWWLWAESEPVWAYSALACFWLAMLGLCIHLGMHGVFRTIGLCMLLGFDSGLLFITFFRKQYWWAWLFTYITIGVVGWEIASYFFGSRW